MPTFTMKVFRGGPGGGDFRDYRVEADEGMVVLDVIHRIQATQAPDLACRWNCKAGKCGSCSAEIDGKPRLMCMTRMDIFEAGATVTVTPIRTFPIIRDLVTDVSYNYVKAKQVPPLRLKPPDPDGKYRMMQEDVDRAQEFHKCIECFLCQDVCHVIRDHEELKTVVRRPALLHQGRRPRHAPARHGRSHGVRPQPGRHRALQHHQVLHRGVPRAHPHHRQRHHPHEGTDGRQLRPDRVAAAKVPGRPEGARVTSRTA